MTPSSWRNSWRGWTRGELTVDVAERVPMAELASVHARAAAGTLSGKVIVLPTSA